MSYKETFNIDYGMNKWEAGFIASKPDSVQIKPFIDTAIELIHLACELGKVAASTESIVDLMVSLCETLDKIEFKEYIFDKGAIRSTKITKLPDTFWQALPDTFWHALDGSKS